MTRSIFDPGGGETERSGSTFRGEEAANRSKMPSDAVDGDVSAVEAIEAQAVAEADAAGLSPAERIEAIPDVDARLAGTGGDGADPQGNA